MNPKTIEIARSIVDVQHNELSAMNDEALELAFAFSVLSARTDPSAIPMSAIIAHEVIWRHESAVTTVNG